MRMWKNIKVVESFSKLNKILDLLSNLLIYKSEYIIESIDYYNLFASKNQLFEKYYELWLFQYNWSIRYYIGEKNCKFEYDNSVLGIPIFPYLKTLYGKLFLKILELYDNKIDLVILSEEDFNSLKEHTTTFNNIQICNYSYYSHKLLKEINFKLSQVNKTGIYGFKDIYRIIKKLSIIYYIEEDSYIKSFFLNLNKNKEFIWEWWNKNFNGKYKGIARTLDLWMLKDNIFNDWDIIIADNTSVTYMRYILKAWWIITMNNNILSHASIVSRELWLPLILGVDNIFLKIFDGDLIEIESVTWQIVILKRFYE